MFFNCKNLLNLDLRKFNTFNVKNMKFMFSHCSLLKELNIENFFTENTKTLEKIFHKINKKCQIITQDKKLLSILNKTMIL
jgi:surface protein